MTYGYVTTCNVASPRCRATDDAVDQFVPIADPDRLRYTWVDRAPHPIAERFYASPEGLLEEL